MKPFKDSVGRDWEITVDSWIAKQIRDEVKLNIGKALTDNVIYQLGTDNTLLAETLWVICREQAEERKINQREFMESVTGDAIDRGRENLLQAIADYYPAAERELIVLQIARYKEIHTGTMAEVKANMEQKQAEANRATKKSESQAA
jgi:hypothetical protein